jgi:antitoxin (DNA-binding transcriptional repressor) of toxin-antitoxin stability system
MKSLTVGSRELKIRLGSYLAQVRQGARIVITDRGHPVAEMRALTGPEGLESRLRELLASGRASWTRPGPLPAPAATLPSGSGVVEALDDDREDRL